MKNLITRSLSGIVYIAVIIGAILLGPNWTTGLMAVFGALALYEYHRMTILDEAYTPVRLAGFILAEIAVAAMILSNIAGWFALWFIALSIAACTLVRFVLALYDSKTPSALNDLSHWVMSLAYIGLPLACAGALWQNKLLLAVFVMIWLNDTGAYCVGSLFGRRKLFERLSPKKSWEGFFGGMAFCLLGGVVFSITGFIGGTGLLQWGGAAVLTCVFATWGDLFESLIKRTCHTKDSGNLIPGHGGILDRIDSLLFVAPIMLVYALFTNMI